MSFFEVIIVQPIFNILMVLYSVIPGGDFGVAVIIFTVLMRLLLWPLVKAQLHQVKAMRKMQPELVKIKKKAKGNRQLEGMMMLELYKKHNVNPFRQIGILLIQLPIFIGLFYVIRIFVDQRNELARFAYTPVEQIASVKHLIENPDTFNQNLFGFIDLTQHAVSANGISIALVLLAVGAGVLQYVSARQTMPETGGKKGIRQIMAEAANGKEADQSEINAAVMRKMTVLLPFMMVFIMLGLPGALALYYAVTTLVAVLQQHILLSRNEQEMEDIATDKPVKSAKRRTEQAKEAQTVDEPKAELSSSLKKKSKKSKKSSRSKVKTTVKVQPTGKKAKKGGRK